MAGKDAKCNNKLQILTSLHHIWVIHHLPSLSYATISTILHHSLWRIWTIWRTISRGWLLLILILLITTIEKILLSWKLGVFRSQTTGVRPFTSNPIPCSNCDCDCVKIRVRRFWSPSLIGSMSEIISRVSFIIYQWDMCSHKEQCISGRTWNPREIEIPRDNIK